MSPADEHSSLRARGLSARFEHLKRYTTLGMATDQGRNRQRQRHRHHGGVDWTLDRRKPEPRRSEPPTHRVAIGALAGHHRGQAVSARCGSRQPHAWAAGAECSLHGNGVVAAPRNTSRAPNERHWRKTVAREVRTVRAAVGFLRRIDAGQDRAPRVRMLLRFLNRLYINTFSTLPIGRGALRRDAARGRVRAR